MASQRGLPQEVISDNTTNYLCTRSELWELINQLEDLINSRPLTHQSADKDNVSLVLNHFLIDKSGEDFAATGVNDTN